MIVETFLRWSETARVTDRANAANALGRAYLHSPMGRDEKQAAAMAMTYLLDDPSPKVRLALAEALAASPDAPRALILSLAEDQAEIAATVITQSPVITDHDFVELAGRGDSFRRGLIASRSGLSRMVSAAIVAVGDEPEVQLLLENPETVFCAASLRDIARRHGQSATIRSLLLERDDLPADARHQLMRHVSDALCGFDLVRATVGQKRLERIAREASDAGTLAIAGETSHGEIPDLVEHLRAGCQLTPAFIMHALCAGRIDFISGVLVNLTRVDERRVRAVLSTGRMHAVRALYEAAGLPRDLSVVFVEATLLLRKAAGSGRAASQTITESLLRQFRNPGAGRNAASELMDMVEKLNILEQRHKARSYALQAVLAA